MTIQEFEKLLNMILIKIQADKIDLDDLNQDYYWKVIGSETYDFFNNPIPVIGSLQDDLVELKKSALEFERFSYLDFDRIAAVLNYISEKQSSDKPDSHL